MNKDIVQLITKIVNSSKIHHTNNEFNSTYNIIEIGSYVSLEHIKHGFLFNYRKLTKKIDHSLSSPLRTPTKHQDFVYNIYNKYKLNEKNGRYVPRLPYNY